MLSSAVASTITGTVINRTTNKPSAGDRVVLYRVAQTMHDEQQAVSDGRGAFRFKGREGANYLVAAFHHAVSYHTGVTNGISPLEISVFDTARGLRGVSEDSDTLFFESDGSTLAITEFFVIFNRSSPPRTLAGERTFDFALPKNAVLDSVAVHPPSTLPHRTSVLLQQSPPRYGIAYPMRPGITKVRVLYHVPYSGSISIAPSVLRPVESLAVKVPPSMQVNTRQENVLEYAGEDNGLSVYVARDLWPGRSPVFTLAGGEQLSNIDQAKAPVETTQFLPVTDSTQVSCPQRQSKREFVGITNRALTLYYEIPVLFTALLIGIGAFVQRYGGATRNGHSISRARTDFR